jgi:sugar lactone lactonase YvrE
VSREIKADVECALDSKGELGECPVWSVAEQAVYWVDISGRKLHRLEPASGAHRFWAMPQEIGCFALREAGGMVVGLRDGFYGFDPDSEVLSLIASVDADEPLLRLNDGRCDPAGRFWGGTVCEPQIPDDPRAALYRLEPDGACTRMVEGLYTSNGLAFAPDGRTMYLSDSFPAVQTIWAYDFDKATGAIVNRRVFATTHDLPGRPDGGAVDAEGCYWSANIDGSQLVRFDPDGKVERTIPLPVRKPTMPCFGGPDLDIIYVTSIRLPDSAEVDPLAGGLLAVAAGVRGQPEPTFAG